jgi:hypothetical protein
MYAVMGMVSLLSSENTPVGEKVEFAVKLANPPINNTPFEDNVDVAESEICP